MSGGLFLLPLKLCSLFPDMRLLLLPQNCLDVTVRHVADPSTVGWDVSLHLELVSESWFSFFLQETETSDLFLHEDDDDDDEDEDESRSWRR